MRRRFRVAGVLILFLALTGGLRAYWIARTVRQVEARKAEEVQEGLSWIERDFKDRLARLEQRARTLAELPAIVAGLRLYARGEPGARENLVRILADRPIPQRGGLELYDPTPRLVAWNGISMPMDEAPGSLRFLESVQTSVALDAGHRAALVVWWPVREGYRVYGAVRVLDLVAFDAPIRNQYLRDFGLADSWSRALQRPVHLVLEGEETLPPAGPSRILQSSAGRHIGQVWLEPPDADTLVGTVRKRFDDVLAFWATLLLFWFAAIGWRWIREAAGPEKPDRAIGRFLVRFLAFTPYWWGTRYALLALDVPARWQTGKAPLAPLFDPTHLASSFGYGLARSTGDLLITAFFAFFFGLAFLVLTARLPLTGLRRLKLRDRLHQRRAEQGSLLRLFVVALVVALLIQGMVIVLATVTHRAIFDSTLDYFSLTGLLPKQLVLVVFCALLVLTLAMLMVSVGLTMLAQWSLEQAGPVAGSPRTWLILVGVAVVLPLGITYPLLDFGDLVPWPVMVAFIGIGLGVVGVRIGRGLNTPGMLNLRNVLPMVFAIAVLVYPLLYQGLEAQQQNWMVDAAESFEEGQDPRVHFALEQVLQKAETPDFRAAFRAVLGKTEKRTALDSVLTSLMQGTLLGALRSHEVNLTIFDARGHPLGRSADLEQTLHRNARDVEDEGEFAILKAMYLERGLSGIYTDLMTSSRQHDRYQYAGLVPLTGEPASDTLGWLWARAIPQVTFREEGFAFPRVLLPAGLYGSPQSQLSLAEFRDGVLVRSQGRNFGRYRLDDEVREALRTRPWLWKREEIKEQAFVTYYRRHETPRAADPEPTLALDDTVIAVRTTAVNIYDHLYYLLRLTVAGLFVGIPIYLLGLIYRRRIGALPARRVRFRDKVLNAFFGVGLVTAMAMGGAGLKVVTGENERAIQSWLRQHLERVEEALEGAVRGDERPYRVLDRIPVDSLARSVGLDLNVYKNGLLDATSRPQLIRDRLIDERMPIQAYLALYFDGFRFTYVEEGLGSFRYTAGYWALTDEEGTPRYVISVPTLPEQERIEEERARTVAYLFGALLLLLLVVMGTAALLASALTRPIGRLRQGLEAAGRGRFERIPPVDTRDEIGELVQAFNMMLEQLAESRYKLAQQERQLAWREMARQVAHEINNPLTPMKLSVQHLRRAFLRLTEAAGDSGVPEMRSFKELFERITGTLVEQIDTLARIANEFSSYARMPRRVMEPLDINAVVQEAVALMQEEAQASLVVALEEDPLVIEADREELRRIFINLIKNALQAIPEGQEARVEVTTERQPDPEGEGMVALCTVTDTGTGIPAPLQEKIFEPNFSTKTRGTGLGLAIVKKSIEDLQGSIGFETEEGVGTTFWVRLPLHPES